MPDLLHILKPHDLGFLRIIAGIWGVDLSSSEPAQALQELVDALLDESLLAEIVETLPVEGRQALAALLAEGGRLPWVAFERRFGEVREMGSGRRDREKPFRQPRSTAEVLWYRALVARAFFDTPSGPQEFAFIPDDLLPILPDLAPTSAPPDEGPAGPVGSWLGDEPPGRPASPLERVHPISASDTILDDACTLLGALRMGLEPEAAWLPAVSPALPAIPASVLQALLTHTGILSAEGLQTEALRTFLEASRGEALAMLVKSWLNSAEFNELRQLPGLAFEGDWKNSPLETRRWLLELLSLVPRGRWWSLPALVRSIRESRPDFQRPAGDYDSWFVRREEDGVFLRGFSSWDEVDGALLRYLVSGMLYWLGIVDLAASDPDSPPSAFRITPQGSRLLKGLAPDDLPAESERLHVSSQGRISVPRLVPRAVRYKVSRFCLWEPVKAGDYRYRVTPGSLSRAGDQGLKPEQLLGLLKRNAASPVPPAFVRAVKRWEANGTEARLDQPVVLRLASPRVLEELRKSKAARYLDEALGPAVVVIKPGSQARVMAALAELGLLAEDETAGDPGEQD